MTEGGREWLVAPMVLLNPGVLAGSKGPLLYTPEDTAAAAAAWNTIPICVNHPSDPDTGSPLSARHPGVLDRQGVGEVRKAIFNGKLRGEGWFDAEKLRAVDRRVYDSLTSGRVVELSTGLYTTNHPSKGVHNGRPYSFLARAHVPDHLAVLSDGQIGACSVSDGCGVLVNVKDAQGHGSNARNASARANLSSEFAEQSGKVKDHQDAAKSHQKAAAANRKPGVEYGEVTAGNHDLKAAHHEIQAAAIPRKAAVVALKSMFIGTRPPQTSEHVYQRGQDAYFNDAGLQKAFKSHKEAGDAIRSAYESGGHLTGNRKEEQGCGDGG